MIRNIVPHILFSIIILLFFTNIQSLESEWSAVKGGNKIIFIRHALAPGGGDPTGFKLKDCKTQRNLSVEGIEQSKRIGKLFNENKINIDIVLSSQWCRCKDTAKYAFGNFKEFSALNSTFQSPFSKNESKQLRDLKNFVAKWDGREKNLVLITHYSIITAVTNAVPKSGEIVITDKKFNVISTIPTN